VTETRVFRLLRGECPFYLGYLLRALKTRSPVAAQLNFSFSCEYSWTAEENHLTRNSDFSSSFGSTASSSCIDLLGRSFVGRRFLEEMSSFMPLESAFKKDRKTLI